MIERWGAFVARRALAVLLAGLVVRRRRRQPTGSASSTTSPRAASTTRTPSRRASWPLEQETFGNQGVDVVAIYSSEELIADDPAFQAEVERVVAGLCARHDEPGASPTTRCPIGRRRAWSAGTGTPPRC